MLDASIRNTKILQTIPPQNKYSFKPSYLKKLFLLSSSSRIFCFISELKQSVELLKNSNELLQDAISGEIGSLKDEVRENTVQEVRKALQANIEAIQRATKLLEKQSDTLTSVMKQKIRELEESKNSFFRYEGLKLYLFWGGMVCNILVFLMLLYGMLGK